ncbi:MAG: DEAD/DEAH box helicase [Bacteroidota bacterium]
MSFKDLSLNASIIKALDEIGYQSPTIVQTKAIPSILNRNDLIVSAETGTGKTAAYALPILQLLFDRQDAPKKRKTIKGLVISPTRELAVQIGKDFKNYGKYTNLRTAVLFGGTSIEPQIDILNKGADIIIATPGRLLDLHKQDLINLDYVESFVLDEADVMLNMGFIDDVKKIERLCPEKKQTLMFSATIPYKVENLAKEILKHPERIDVTSQGASKPDINQILYYVPKRQKIALCLHLLRNEIKGNILIFRRTKFGVDKLAERLVEKGYQAERLHGDRSQSERQTALNKFKNGMIKILVATDVASRGIDVEKLDAVINFDLPSKAETYVHRIGRTGRAGEVGRAYSFCSADEKAYVKSIENLINYQIPIDQNHPFLLDPNAKPTVHKKKGSKYKKGRKGEGAKKRKKRWY